MASKKEQKNIEEIVETFLLNVDNWLAFAKEFQKDFAYFLPEVVSKNKTMTYFNIDELRSIEPNYLFSKLNITIKDAYLTNEEKLLLVYCCGYKYIIVKGANLLEQESKINPHNKRITGIREKAFDKSVHIDSQLNTCTDFFLNENCGLRSYQAVKSRVTLEKIDCLSKEFLVPAAILINDLPEGKNNKVAIPNNCNPIEIGKLYFLPMKSSEVKPVSHNSANTAAGIGKPMQLENTGSSNLKPSRKNEEHTATSDNDASLALSMSLITTVNQSSTSIENTALSSFASLPSDNSNVVVYSPFQTAEVSDLTCQLDSLAIKQTAQNLSAYTFQCFNGDKNCIPDFMLKMLDANLKSKTEEFVLVMEIIFKYVHLKYSFINFFMLCESLPERHFNQLQEKAKLEGVKFDMKKEKVVKAGEKFLFGLCKLTFKFLKAYVVLSGFEKKHSVMIMTDDKLDSLLNDFFPDVQSSFIIEYKKFLLCEDLMKSVQNLCRKEELVLDLMQIKGIKDVKQKIINAIVDKFMDSTNRQQSINFDVEAMDILKAVATSKATQDAVNSQSVYSENKIKALSKALLNYSKNELGTEDISTSGTYLRNSTVSSRIDYANQSASTQVKKRKSDAAENSVDVRRKLPVGDTDNEINEPMQKKNRTTTVDDKSAFEDTNKRRIIIESGVEEDSSTFGDTNKKQKSDDVQALIASIFQDDNSPGLTPSAGLSPKLTDTNSGSNLGGDINVGKELSHLFDEASGHNLGIDNDNSSLVNLSYQDIILSSVEDVFQFENELQKIIDQRRTRPNCKRYVTVNSYLRLLGPSELKLQDGEGNSGWLDDEVINCYMDYFQERNNILVDIKRASRFYFFSSFFFVKYENEGFDAVKRWTKNKPIFESEQTIYPIHVGGCHWVRLVIKFLEKKVIYYDSFHTDGAKYLSLAGKYLKEEAEAKKVSGFDFSQWSFGTSKNMATQKDGFNCGVFVLMSIRASAYGLRQNLVKADEMREYRLHICKELLQDRLLPIGDFDCCLQSSSGESSPNISFEVLDLTHDTQDRSLKNLLLSPIHVTSNLDTTHIESDSADFSILNDSKTSMLSNEDRTELNLADQKLKEFQEYFKKKNIILQYSWIPMSTTNKSVFDGVPSPLSAGLKDEEMEKEVFPTKLSPPSDPTSAGIKEDQIETEEFSLPPSDSNSEKLIKETLSTNSLQLTINNSNLQPLPATNINTIFRELRLSIDNEEMRNKTSFLLRNNNLFSVSTEKSNEWLSAMCITLFWHSLSIYLNSCLLHPSDNVPELYHGGSKHKVAFDALHLIFQQGANIHHFIDNTQFTGSDNNVDINGIRTLSEIIKLYFNSFYCNNGVQLTSFKMKLSLGDSTIGPDVYIDQFQYKLDENNNFSDLSILVIDIEPFSYVSKRAKEKYVDFPNVLYYSRNEIVVAYQTVGAIYEYLNGTLPEYETLILRREYWNSSDLQNDNYYKYKMFSLSGRTIKESDQKSFKSTLDIRDKEFNIIGVIMIHNSGQKPQQATQEDFYCKLNENEIVRISPIVNEIRFSDFTILSNWKSKDRSTGNTWFEDTHMNEILGQSCYIYNEDSKSGQRNVIIRSSVFANQVFDYEASKSLWKYENIFTDPSAYFHMAINYPSNNHWVYVCICAEQKIVLYYDPKFSQTRYDKIKPRLQEYIKGEETENTPQLGTTSKSWQFITPSAAAAQKDNENCGVYVCVAAIKVIAERRKYPTTTLDEYQAQLSFPYADKDIANYRKSFESFLSGTTGKTNVLRDLVVKVEKK